MVIVHKWAAAKSGHEFEFALAWKHRVIAGRWLLRASKPWNSLLRPRLYQRAFHLWADAVDRIKIHGRDIVT